MPSSSSNRTKKKTYQPDFCPAMNADMKFGKGGIIIHNDKFCVAKPLYTNSLLYVSFNKNNKKKNKLTYMVKEHTENADQSLKSITFFGITTKEYDEKRALFKSRK